MALFELKNVSKRVGGKWALWDVSLEIDAGETVCILGRSGSGKSTLAGILAGLDEPTSGTVVVDDRDAGPRVSLALSAPAFAPELTVYENLQMFATLQGVPGRKRAKQIGFVLELLELNEWRSLRASCLSQGALKRLEIAKSLLATSPLLVIDSLLDSLEREVLERLWEHLSSLRHSDMRTVVVFTNSGKIANLCPRVVVLHNGRIGFVGRPDDFRRLAGEDVVVLGGVDSPRMKNRLQEQFSVVIKEEDGFLSFRVGNGERVASELLSEFGSELGCVYLKRPTLEDALDVMASGTTNIIAGRSERKIE